MKIIPQNFFCNKIWQQNMLTGSYQVAIKPSLFALKPATNGSYFSAVNMKQSPINYAFTAGSVWKVNTRLKLHKLKPNNLGKRWILILKFCAEKRKSNSISRMYYHFPSKSNKIIIILIQKIHLIKHLAHHGAKCRWKCLGNFSGKQKKWIPRYDNSNNNAKNVVLENRESCIHLFVTQYDQPMFENAKFMYDENLLREEI